MIGDRCARCTGLALQAFFSAQLQRLPQALTIRMIPFNNQGSPFNNHCKAVFSTVSTHNSFPGVFQNCRTAT